MHSRSAAPTMLESDDCSGRNAYPRVTEAWITGAQRFYKIYNTNPTIIGEGIKDELLARTHG